MNYINGLPENIVTELDSFHTRLQKRDEDIKKGLSQLLGKAPARESETLKKVCLFGEHRKREDQLIWKQLDRFRDKANTTLTTLEKSVIKKQYPQFEYILRAGIEDFYKPLSAAQTLLRAPSPAATTAEDLSPRSRPVSASSNLSEGSAATPNNEVDSPQPSTALVAEIFKDLDDIEEQFKERDQIVEKAWTRAVQAGLSAEAREKFSLFTKEVEATTDGQIWYLIRSLDTKVKLLSPDQINNHEQYQRLRHILLAPNIFTAKIKGPYIKGPCPSGASFVNSSPPLVALHKSLAPKSIHTLPYHPFPPPIELPIGTISRHREDKTLPMTLRRKLCVAGGILSFIGLVVATVFSLGGALLISLIAGFFGSFVLGSYREKP